MAAAFFSFRNEVDQYYRDNLINPISVEPGTSIAAGSLDNLLTRQLHRGITIAPSGLSCGIETLVRGPLYSDVGPPPDNRGRAEVRVAAILGLHIRDLVDFNRPQWINLFGYDTVTSNWVPLAAKQILLTPHDTSGAPLNVILTEPWLGGETGRFRLYKFEFQFRDANDDPAPATFGGVWVGNAVEFTDGVDAQWALSVADAGSLSTTRGGQVYARPAPPRRTLRVTLANLDERTAYGIGLPAFDYWGRELGSNYLADAAKHLGATGPCIMVPRVKPADLPSGNRDWIKHAAVYGHLTRPIEITHRTGPYYTSSIDMVEEF